MTRDTSAVGWTMSSISSLTERTAVSQPPRAFLTRPRWVILPSLPTTLERRSNSCVISSLRVTTSLKRLAISPSTPSTSSGKRTDELAAIDKVPRGLDIHGLLQRYTPPALVDPMQPPDCDGSYVSKYLV